MAEHARPEEEVVVDLKEPAPAAAAPAEADVVDLPEGEGPPDAPRLPRQAVLLPDGRVKLPLRYPVTLKLRQAGQVREESYETLVLRRMNGADMRAVANAGDAASVVALARLAGLGQVKAEALHDRMDLSDITAFGDVLGFFSGTGRKTGR